MALDCRIADGKADAVLIFNAYKTMHGESLVPGDFIDVKVLANVLRMVNGPDSCVLMAMDGEHVAGVLGLVKGIYWWNEDAFLEDKGLYVLPEYRKSEAFDLLMNGAQSVSDETGLPVYLTINNGRRKRGGRSKWERIGATLGYTNRGAIIAHFPET